MLKIVVGQEQFSVYFETDKFELKENEMEKLVSWIEGNKNSKILSLIGMTDEKGTTIYNDTLSKKRVDFVIEQIGNKIKFREDYRAIALGERDLISNIDELNRKVTIYFLPSELLFLENRIINNYLVNKQLKEVEIVEKENIDFLNGLPFEEQLKSAPRGTLFTLKDIHFDFNSANLLYSSKLQLDKWVKVLQDNERLKIIVIGHICCVKRDDYDLSTLRAESVMNYFVSSKIDSERIKYIGFGSSKPKFKIPEKNGYESLQNRRVEILILEN
jgi:outer membrane protein OmpA-like peptidoglycan-associated protein